VKYATPALVFVLYAWPALAQDDSSDSEVSLPSEEVLPVEEPAPSEEPPPPAPAANTDQIAHAVLMGELAPAPKTQAAAPRVSGQISTELYLSHRPAMMSLGDGRYALRAADRVYPFYTTFQLRAEDAGIEGLSVHFQGWAGLDLADIYFDERFVADPTYLYARFARSGVDARLGRQMVFSGAARGLTLDGVWASYKSPFHLGIEVLGGLLVMPYYGQDFGSPQATNATREDFGRGYSDWRREGDLGDLAVGGRLFYQMVENVTAGVSFLHRTRKLEAEHQQLGADLRVQPARWIEILGDALMDLQVLEVQEANLAVDFFPVELLSFGVDYRHANPTLYLSHMSIFSVFSDEEYDAVGGNIRLRPTSDLSLYAAYHHHLSSSFSHQDAALAAREYRSEVNSSYDMQVGGKWLYDDQGGVATLELRRFSTGNAVNGARLGVLVPLPFEGLRAAGNAYIDIFDEEVRDRRMGVTGDVGLYYGRRAWRAGGSFLAAATPYAQAELRGMLRLSYGFGQDFAARREP
jgi:hypothetical protein